MSWIDTHHHIVPEIYAKALESAGGDPTGWPTPVWSHDSALKTMAQLGIAKAIPSVTAPAATLFSGEQGRALARQLNEYSHELVKTDPGHFPGYFASLPRFNDVDGAVREIEHAFTQLAPAGVTVFTSYPVTLPSGEKEWRYLGHPTFAPVWAALAKHNAVVFVHPSQAPSPQPNQWLLPPIMDYPHETARSAADLILRGVVKEHPSLRFILSHAGGTLPMLAQRMAFAPYSNVSSSEIMEAIRSFYYDVALSTSPAQIKALLEITPVDHVLFGSDTPYAPFEAIARGVGQLQSLDPQLLAQITQTNATSLFPQLKKANDA